jgi:hypothetical protein
LLGEEILADADGGIADAVNEDIVTRVEAADEEAVAEGIAALAGAERHAGGGARHFLETGRVLVVEQLPGEHRDRFRRVGDRLAEFRRGKAVRFIRRGRIGIRIAVGRRCGRAFRRRGRRLRGLLRPPGAAQRGTNAQLLGGRLGDGGFFARDRRFDGDRRQRRLRSRAGDRSDCDQAADGDLASGVDIVRLVEDAVRNTRTQCARQPGTVHDVAPTNRTAVVCYGRNC